MVPLCPLLSALSLCLSFLDLSFGSIDWNLSTAWNYVTQKHKSAAPLRDNRTELLRYELSTHHKNSMFESNARLVDLPFSKETTKSIQIRLATGSFEEAAQCLKIYTPIVYDTTITFEIIPPTVEVSR
jgi:hypothetical protein